MPLRIFHDCDRTIKAHWLVIEQGSGEGSQVMTFQVSASVSD